MQLAAVAVEFGGRTIDRPTVSVPALGERSALFHPSSVDAVVADRGALGDGHTRDRRQLAVVSRCRDLIFLQLDPCQTTLTGAPAAMQNELETHETADSPLAVTDPAGVGSMVQLAPFHASRRA